MEDESNIPKTLEDQTCTKDPETVLHSPQENDSLSKTVPTVPDPELISVCTCILKSGTDSLEKTAASNRKRRIYSNELRTGTYLRERRISELVRYILAKMLCIKPIDQKTYVIELLDECMLFRSGLGKAPVLFEERHIEAIVKSFDPGDRGWLSAGQVRRAYITLGLTPKSNLEVKTPTTEVLRLLREDQESELLSLLTASSEVDYEFFD